MPLSCFFLSFGLRKISRQWQYFSWAIAAAWLVFGPPFFKVQTGFDGLYERFVSLILLCWTVTISWLLVRKGVNHSLE
jgi:hypothetical protein